MVSNDLKLPLTCYQFKWLFE